MNINSQTLAALYTGFQTTFRAGFGAVASSWQRVAMQTNSTTREEQYAWLNALPGMREWIGDRQIKNVSQSDYTIRNKDYEETVSVQRNDIRDDRLGSYGKLFEALGEDAAKMPDILVWSQLKAGFTTPCHDKQYFFDTDHPVLDAAGAAQSVSNFGGGAGTPWFLLDTTRAVKPMIYQSREAFQLVRQDQPTDDNVFMRKEYVYGVDGRCSVGYGFWQLGYASKQTLDATNYEAARSAMMSFKRDGGQPLGVVPNLLVVPPSLEGAGRRLLTNAMTTGGATNEWAGSAELLVVPWLA